MTAADHPLGIDPAGGDPERAVALGYAPRQARAGVAALFALDATLARLARGTRDAAVAQLRLAWWRDTLARPADAWPAGQPILAALAGAVLPAGVEHAALIALVDAWEALLGDDPAAHARARGRALFGAARTVLAAQDAVTAAGEGWALADLARTTPDPATAAVARDQATIPLAAATAQRWSRPARPLGALALSAAMDVTGIARGAPLRPIRLIRLRLTGRSG